MIRFEVTGATPEEFAENAMKAWGLLAIGLQSAMIGAKIATQVEAAVRDMTPTQTCGSESSSSAPIPITGAQPTNGSESSSTVSKADEAPAEKKIEERKKVHADKVDDLFMEQKTVDSAPAVGVMPAKPTKTAKNSSKGPKLDDLKTRLSEVIVAATDRWDQKRANAYARKLLYAVGVEKLSALDPKCYDDFMQHSEIYLDGTHPE